MTRFLHLLTTVAILMHTTVGCCASEAHGVAGQCCGQMESHGIESDSHGHHCHTGKADHSSKVAFQMACPSTRKSSSDSHKSEQPTPHECCHDDCQWPAPEARSCIDLMLLGFAGNSPWILTSPQVLVLGDGRDSLLPLFDVLTHTVPLRTHLAKCVLLI